MSARHKSNESFGLGFLRPLGAVIVLTAFILAITFTVKGLGQLRVQDVVAKTAPLLAKLNINLKDSKYSKLNEFGQVAGNMVSKIKNTNLGGGGSSSRVEDNPDISTKEPISESTEQEIPLLVKKELFTIAVMADSHNNFENLSEALNLTKQYNISKVLFLGDYTELGLVEDLESAKKIMDGSGLSYFSLSGDHDLWKSVGHENFKEVFGNNRYSIQLEGAKIVMLDNSANYTVIPSEDLSWFEKEVSDADFVFLSQPLYYPKLDRFMGHVNGEDVTTVLEQRNALLSMIRASTVKAVIAADLHNSDNVSDPEKNSLKHILIGGLTEERNLQTPRFSIFKYYEDSSYELQDVVLE